MAIGASPRPLAPVALAKRKGAPSPPRFRARVGTRASAGAGGLSEAPLSTGMVTRSSQPSPSRSTTMPRPATRTPSRPFSAAGISRK